MIKSYLHFKEKLIKIENNKNIITEETKHESVNKNIISSE